MKTLSQKFIPSVLTAFVLLSCNSQLDIQPVQTVDSSKSLLTSKDVQGTLIGAYSQLGSTNLYSGGTLIYPDLLASTGGDINFFGTFQGLSQISNKSIPINNDFVTGLWLDAYAAINTTNEVLNALNLVDTTQVKRVEGEAKFIRGSLYFELVKNFGRAWNDGDPTQNLGVPILLTPTQGLSDALAKPARSTVKQVYDQAISDLMDAEKLLPTPQNGTYYFATTGAAAAQLSRVYLFKGDFANARDAANRVISSGYYQLMSNYKDEFPYVGRGARIYNTAEDIFSLQVSEQQGTNSMNTFYGSPSVGGRGDIEVPSNFLALFESGDTRAQLFTDDGSGSLFYSDKFDNIYGNVKIIRLAEMYLTRAECNFRLGTAVGDTPTNDVNMIRSRAKITPLSSVVLADILNERKLELAFEGQWLFDYKRTATTNPSWGNSLTWDSPQMVFPIPQRELLVNPNLVQNPGY